MLAPMSLISTERKYHGRVISLDVDTVKFPDGSQGQLEMVRHPGASAIVPLLDPPDSADPRVLLLRQFRHATDGYVWEIPAGRLDPGESPEECAHRELKEETGMQAGRLRHLTTIWTTPGFTDERIWLFLATGLAAGRQDLQEDESLTVERLPLARALALALRGGIDDGKSIAGLVRAAAHLGVAPASVAG